MPFEKPSLFTITEYDVMSSESVFLINHLSLMVQSMSIFPNFIAIFILILSRYISIIQILSKARCKMGICRTGKLIKKKIEANCRGQIWFWKIEILTLQAYRWCLMPILQLALKMLLILCVMWIKQWIFFSIQCFIFKNSLQTCSWHQKSNSPILQLSNSWI